MSVQVPWVSAPSPTTQGAPAQAPAPTSNGSANLGTLLVVGIVATGIFQWIHGRYKAQQEDERAREAENRLDEMHFDLEGAREDEQLRLAQAFAARPAGTGLGWGR
jgi:hypothetical protein